MAIIFEMPVAGVVLPVRHASGGAPRYILAVPLGLILGACFVLLDWHLGKYLWSQAQKHNQRAQSVIAIGLVFLQLCLIIAGAVTGERLGKLIVDSPRT
jgi:heme A synthase